jgi:acyl carrier protein
MGEFKVSELKQEVIEIIRGVANLDKSANLDTQSSLKELGVDSLEVMNVFLNIAEKYEIEIPDEEIDRLDTIDMIADYLKRRLEKA